MLKLMIVDDEAVIRKGIATIVDWTAMGIELVAEASNGRDALNRALLCQPDIVLTDIKMPLVNGIEFARLLLEKRPQTRVVFLTGYSDYEYMKSAVKLGAVDYLLKPVRVLELEEMICRIREDILQERQKKQQENSVTKLLTRNRPVLRGNCLYLFMNGRCSASEFFERAFELEIPVQGPAYVAIVLEIDDYSRISRQAGNDYEMRYAVLNIAEEMLLQVGPTVFGYLPEESRLIGIVNLENGEPEDVAEACRQVQFYIRQFLNFTVTAAISARVTEPEALPEACRYACNALDQKIYAGKNQVLLPKDGPVNPSRKTILLKKADENELREAISMRNNLRLQKKLDEIFDTYLSSERYSARSLRQFGFTLLMIALHTLEDERISQEEAFGANARLSEEMASYETVDEIHMFLKNIYFRTLQALENQNTAGSSRIVRDAMKYMRQNYANNIQAADVAGAACVTPNYFSRVFRQETGETFTEWLNKFRVERAKELLKTQSDEKIYEIAEQVGFGDYKYFSFIFKKYTGYSPVTYKKLNY